MAYKSFGLAALLVSALRSAVALPDDDTKAELEKQREQIAGVRTAFDGINERLDGLTKQLADNGSVDSEQHEALQGIQNELAEMAAALTGPADDDDDNGVLAEVEAVEGAPISPTADALVEQAETPAADEGAERSEAEGEEQA